MSGKLTKEQRDNLWGWFNDAKEQKRTTEQWLQTQDKKLKELEGFIGKPLIALRAVMESYRQTLSKLDEEIKNLEAELKQ